MTTDIELVHQEYLRLHGVIESYASSSFADFELLAVVGAVLAWKPFADRFLKHDGDDTRACQILLLGFLAILFLLVIIATRDLLKQSVIAFHVQQIAPYEAALSAHLGDGFGPLFRGAPAWERWVSEVHFPVSLHFRGLVAFLVIVVPTAALWRCAKSYALGYLVAAFALLGVYSHAVSYVLSA